MGKTLREKFNELNRYCDIHHCCDCPLKDKSCNWYDVDYDSHVDEESFVKAIEEDYDILFPEDYELTLDEMKERIDEKCKSFEGCAGCPLDAIGSRDLFCSSYTWVKDGKDKMREHYNIMFGITEEETTPPPTLLKVDEIEKVSGLETATITLTKSEVDNLIDFFDTDFIQTIRDDEGIDNMGYLCDMCSIYKKLEDAQAELDI